MAKGWKNPTANYLALLYPSSPFFFPLSLLPPRGKSKISCFNISHPPNKSALCKHTLPLSHTLTSWHLYLFHPHQIGRQSVECASVVLLCRLQLVVCDLSTALMCFSLNPRPYLMISLSLSLSLSAVLSLPLSPSLPLSLSGGHTIDFLLMTVSSSCGANCLTVTTKRGLMRCEGEEPLWLSPHSLQWAGCGLDWRALQFFKAFHIETAPTH